MVKTLYIMCGPAGAGKSTYAMKHMGIGNSAYISRDRIRFDMVGEDEEYFSKEFEVYAEFCRQIGLAIDAPWIEEVWADATHLTTGARAKLLNTINRDLTNVRIVPIVVMPTLDTCLKQNAYRTGRGNVPDTVIKKMYWSFKNPREDGIDYEEVIEVYGNLSDE